MSDAQVIRTQDEAEILETSSNPDRILIFSGKRKSGKDFITDELYKRLGPERSVILKLSGPIKSHWAKAKNLDLSLLLGDGKYKENYRYQMTKWGEDIRKEDYGYFCRAAILMYNANKASIWIVSDARRKTDLKWFKETYGDKCKTIRISCSEEVRKSRGWSFCKGIDDSETECNLDEVKDWDLELNNSGDDIELIMQKLLDISK